MEIHGIQAVVGGVAEEPLFFTDKSLAETAFTTMVFNMFPGDYYAYCRDNGLDEDLFSSAKGMMDYARDNDMDLRREVVFWTTELRGKIGGVPEDCEFAGDGGCAGPCHRGKGDCAQFPPLPLEEPEEENPTEQEVAWLAFVNKVKGVFRVDSCLGECRLFPRGDWKAEVESGDTVLGYWEWAAGRIDTTINELRIDGYHVSEDLQSLGVFFFSDPGGNASKMRFDSEEEAWCAAAVHKDYQ